MNLTEECGHSVSGEMTELARFSPGLLTAAATLTIIIMITGLAGNSLTIVALLFRRNRGSRSPGHGGSSSASVATTFIISLSVADLIFCFLVLPFSASRFINRGWIHGSLLCQLFPLMRYGNLGVSLLSITMITINRYMMITNNSLYTRLYRPAWIGAMITFCWVLSFGMQIPTLLGLWGRFGYDPLLQTCTILPTINPNTGIRRSSKTALFITAFVIPCTIIIFCYAKIFWTVHKSERRMQRHLASPGGPGQPLSASVGTNGGQEMAKSRSRNEWRITKMVLVIFLSFLACYLPITVIKVVDKCVEHPVLHVIGYILVYLSACVNPIIYVFMNKEYRRAVQDLLTSLCPSWSSWSSRSNGSGSHATNRFIATYHVLFPRTVSKGPQANGNTRNECLGQGDEGSDVLGDGHSHSQTLMSEISLAVPNGHHFIAKEPL